MIPRLNPNLRIQWRGCFKRSKFCTIWSFMNPVHLLSAGTLSTKAPSWLPAHQSKHYQTKPCKSSRKSFWNICLMMKTSKKRLLQLFGASSATCFFRHFCSNLPETRQSRQCSSFPQRLQHLNAILQQSQRLGIISRAFWVGFCLPPERVISTQSQHNIII